MRAMHSDGETYKMLEKSILKRLGGLPLGLGRFSGSRGLKSQGERVRVDRQQGPKQIGAGERDFEDGLDCFFSQSRSSTSKGTGL